MSGAQLRSMLCVAAFMVVLAVPMGGVVLADPSGPVYLAKGGGGGGPLTLPGGGKSPSGPGAGGTGAVPNPKVLAGYAAFQSLTFASIETTTKDGVKASVLHGKTGENKDVTLPLITPRISYFNEAGEVLPLDKLTPGQQVDAVLFTFGGTYEVVALRQSNVVIKQRKVRVFSANASEEVVTLSDPAFAGSASFPTDNTLLVSDSGPVKRFGDIRPATQVEAMWKDEPGKRVLILLKP